MSPIAVSKAAGVSSGPTAERACSLAGPTPENRDVVRPQPPEYHPARLAMTGATGALGRRFLQRVLTTMPEVQVTALVRTSSPSFKATEIRQMMDKHAKRLTILDSDLRHGKLSPVERKQFTETDGGLWHFAASTNLKPGDEKGDCAVREINFGGTTRLLEMLQGSDRPGGFYHLSTAYVCGDRTGVIREEDLNVGQKFRNSYEESKYHAEALVRQHRDAGLKAMILRPSLVTNESAGDSTGHILDVLASFFSFAARSGRALSLPMPITASINAIQVDWLVKAMLALAPHIKASRTYHLTARTETCVKSVCDAFTRLFGSFAVNFVTSMENFSTGAAARINRMLAPFRPYFEACVHFDRTKLETDAPQLAAVREIDLDTALLLWRKSVAR